MLLLAVLKTLCLGDLRLGSGGFVSSGGEASAAAAAAPPSQP